MFHLLRCALVWLLWIAFTAPAIALDVKLITFETGPKAAQPSVVVDAREGFVVTWQERGETTSTLRYAVLDPEGQELRRGTVSSGADRFINAADFPSLAVLDNGDWVTFWLQKTESGTYAYEIRTTRSRDAGQHWDSSIVIHRDATPTEHGFVSMTPAGGDRVRFVWLDGRRMAATADAHGEGGDEHMTLRTATLRRDGKPTDEGELDTLTCACCQTDMVRGKHSSLAVYRDRTPEELRDIGFLSLTGKNWSKTRLVHADRWTMPGCPVNGPALAASGERYFVVWPTMASGEMEIRGAFGAADSFEPPITIASGASETGRVDVAAWGTDQWIVSRVTTSERVPALALTRVGGDGANLSETTIASPVGGFPRLAVHGDVALIVFTEPAASGASRVGVARVRAAP